MRNLIKGIKTKIITNLHQVLEAIFCGNHHIHILKISKIKKTQREIEQKMEELRLSLEMLLQIQDLKLLIVSLSL
jgi:hypothetical protein